MNIVAVQLVRNGGLTYVHGLPRWIEWVYRGTTFMLAVMCAGMLIGMLSQRAVIKRGLWWVGMACFLICARTVVVQVERWEVPLTIETVVSLPALLALTRGMYLRLRDGTIGQ